MNPILVLLQFSCKRGFKDNPNSFGDDPLFLTLTIPGFWGKILTVGLIHMDIDIDASGMQR